MKRYRLALLLVLLSISSLLGACATVEEDEPLDDAVLEDIRPTPLPDDAGVSPIGGFHTVTLRELTDDPEEFIGQKVQVRGEVDEIFSVNAFTLETDELVDNEILVVVGDPNRFPTPLQLENYLGQEVYVLGTVEQFVLVEFEDEFILNLDEEDERQVVRFEGLPVLVAEAVASPSEAGAMAALDTQFDLDDLVGPVDVPVNDPVLALPVLAEMPEPYVGEVVIVPGKVDEILDLRAFRLTSKRVLPGGEVLVLNTAIFPFTPDYLEKIYGELVEVTGLVGIFELEAVEEEFGLDLDDEVFIEFEGKPFIQEYRIQPAN